MEAVGGAAAGGRYARAAAVLGSIERHLDPAYDVVKLGRMALGDAPISFASTAATGLLKAAFGSSSDERLTAVVHHAGLAADGLARGLLYSGGLLHGAAAAKTPWLVVSRTPPAGTASIARTLGTVGNLGRLGLLGIGGSLGAIRAARAVAEAGTPRALVETKEGRAGALQAVGSALLVAKHPASYLAGAAVFAAAIVNEFTTERPVTP